MMSGAACLGSKPESRGWTEELHEQDVEDSHHSTLLTYSGSQCDQINIFIFRLILVLTKDYFNKPFPPIQAFLQ